MVPERASIVRATSVSHAALAATLAVVAVAAITSTLLEAVGALVAVAVAALVVQAVSGSVLPDGKGILVAGVEFLSFAPAIYLPIAIAAPVLWLQYVRRRTVLARAIMAGACTAAMVPVVTPPPAMFGVLRLLKPATDGGPTAGVALAPGCFPRIATETESGGTSDEAQRLWNGDERARAGRPAIAFSTTVFPTGLPAGWKAMIGYAQAFFADADGSILHRLQGASAVFGRPDRLDASVSATHFWLASRNAYEDAERRFARLRLKYFVSLLEPMASTEIAVNGGRQYVSGFGYCSTGIDASHDAVSIDCFRRGTRPALVTARWSGGTGAREAMTYPDYMPAMLEILSGAKIDAVAGHKRVHHTGTMPGFRATIHRYVDDKLTVIVLTNTGHADPGSIARLLAESYLPGLVEPRAAVPQRTAIKVDPNSFDAYVGRYQPNPAITVTVSREGDKLMFESAGGKVELLPESDDSFFSNALPVTIRFVKDETGKVTHLILFNNGREGGRARKID